MRDTDWMFPAATLVPAALLLLATLFGGGFVVLAVLSITGLAFALDLIIARTGRRPGFRVSRPRPPFTGHRRQPLRPAGDRNRRPVRHLAVPAGKGRAAAGPGSVDGTGQQRQRARVDPPLRQVAVRAGQVGLCLAAVRPPHLGPSQGSPPFCWHAARPQHRAAGRIALCLPAARLARLFPRRLAGRADPAATPPRPRRRPLAAPLRPICRRRAGAAGAGHVAGRLASSAVLCSAGPVFADAASGVGLCATLPGWNGGHCPMAGWNLSARNTAGTRPMPGPAG